MIANRLILFALNLDVFKWIKGPGLSEFLDFFDFSAIFFKILSSWKIPNPFFWYMFCSLDDCESNDTNRVEFGHQQVGQKSRKDRVYQENVQSALDFPEQLPDPVTQKVEADSINPG